MKYKEIQRQKAINLRSDIFKDPGDGIYKKYPREFVLSEPELNLWSGIREDALDYFAANKITWWDSGNEPTGHLLSSQIACLNHLYFLRQRVDLSTQVLKNINPEIQKAIVVDTGFVEFEKVGKEKLGNEKQLTRGAKCTSIDALMIGENLYSKRILFLIEWKYTESYSSENKLRGDSGKERLNAYLDLLNEPDCPVKNDNIVGLFYEPFYQLMRQALLGWQMSLRKEYGAEDWMHIHVIPTNNIELRETITSPYLNGKNINDAWKSVLKQENKYFSIDPKDFIRPVMNCPDTKSIITYLNKRYWD